MKAPKRPGASKLKGHLMRFIQRHGFNPLVPAKPCARGNTRENRRDLSWLCLCLQLPQNHLGLGMDRQTDTRSVRDGF